jgi:hypothetical protein
MDVIVHIKMELLFKLDAKYQEWLVKNTPDSLDYRGDEKQLYGHYEQIASCEGDFKKEMNIKPNMQLCKEILLYLHSVGEINRESIADPVQGYLLYKLKKENWLYMYNSWQS